MNGELSIQERFAPNNRCFGCGPANEQGLRIRSFVEGDELIARWRPSDHHEAFPGMLNGGICGALLDCHGNWAAAHRLMGERGEPTPPCTVTARYGIELKRPTPTDVELVLRARVVLCEGDRAEVTGELIAGDKVTATMTGLFVAVREGHPAYHRW